MPVKNETSTRFRDEVDIISPVAYVFAAIGFLVVWGAVVFATLHDKSHNPFYTLPVLVPLGLLAGTAIACYILLIGYINGDAGRRGMSRLAWTLLAIFVPNALGIVLYFVLRKPRMPCCPQCNAFVDPGFGYCPRCRYRLMPVCPQCQRSVHDGDKFCPYCGSDLTTSVSPLSAALPNQN
ncbi:MAG: zinc ribbon domain-containing protein [Acidobacteriota bacterium]|nr:zinc ribbon domain-containing protein [Acidobacteriota bacterium]